MLKPLGLPPGSVRALLLLGLGARAIFDLRAHHGLPGWLGMALVISAAAYFSARASAAERGDRVPDQPTVRRHPLWLPAGTVRLLFLVVVAYGAWLFFRDREGSANVPAAWILGAFTLGVLMRALLSRLRRPPDVGTGVVWHLQALTVLLAVAGLVLIAALGKGDPVAPWVEPVLAAGCVYYFATR